MIFPEFLFQLSKTVKKNCFGAQIELSVFCFKNENIL